MISFAILLPVGIVSGFFPAPKASWLNPIESTQVSEINLGHVEA
jgi:hypothetical protein